MSFTKFFFVLSSLILLGCYDPRMDIDLPVRSDLSCPAQIQCVDRPRDYQVIESDFSELNSQCTHGRIRPTNAYFLTTENSLLISGTCSAQFEPKAKYKDLLIEVNYDPVTNTSPGYKVEIFPINLDTGNRFGDYIIDGKTGRLVFKNDPSAPRFGIRFELTQIPGRDSPQIFAIYSIKEYVLN